MLKRIYKSLITEKQRINNRLLFEKLTSVFYRGNKFSCNICGKNFRKFKPIISLDVREKEKCPFCGSLGRYRLLLFYLQNETKIFTQKASLLHFAPEYGLRAIFKKTKTLTYINGDYNAAYADEQIDITNIPYPDETFDYVICSHVLEYVPDEFKAMQEIRRVLKPDGIALIFSLIDWNCPHTCGIEKIEAELKRLKLSSDYYSERLYGSDFADRLRKGGFQVEVIDYLAKFTKEMQRRYSLGTPDDATIFRCTK